MTMTNKDILDEIALARSLGPSSIATYSRAIECYTKFHKMSLEDLLEEADSEEEQGIRWKNRKLKQRLIAYRQFLMQNYKKATIKSYFTSILVVYKHYDIEIHTLPPINQRKVKISEPIGFSDLLTHEEIDLVLKNTNRKFNAVILFMTSSGCAMAETHSLSIQQFLDSTYDYHGKKDILEALEVLKTMNDVVPTFYLKRLKTNKYYYTFCSPEAVKSIVNYLLHDRVRYNDQGDLLLHPTDPLFQFGKCYLAYALNQLNDRLNLGTAGSYGRLRSHMFRKFHASTLKKAGMSESDIDSLQGRGKSSTRASYFYEDPAKLREQYIQCLPSLVINDNVNILDFKTPEFRKLESELDEKSNELQKMNSRMDQLEDLILNGIDRSRLEKINKLI